MLAWILAAGLAAAVAVIVVLAFRLRRSRAGAADADALVASARAALISAIEEQTAAHQEEIRRTIARERAESLSLLVAEERRLADEHRAEFVERERRSTEALVDTMSQSERRLDERLRGFGDDLDRAQRHLEAQLQKLQQRHEHAIAEVEGRIDAEAAELGSTADEQRRVHLRLRDELERVASQAVTEALDELEAQTVERRRSIEEITERLRTRETAIADSIDRAETDVRARLDVVLVEWERRQTERLERVTEREIDRHIQVAAQAFDERMREIREEAATELRNELDRAVAALAREELVRRLDAGV
jgi:hypothetical protein